MPQQYLGDRKKTTIALPSDHYEVYLRAAEAMDLDVGKYITMQMAQAKGLPVPDYVWEFQDRQREKRREAGEKEAARRRRERAERAQGSLLAS